MHHAYRTVGGQAFATQKELRERVRAILYRYTLGADLNAADQAFMADFFTAHERATEKIGCGVASIQVVSDGYGSRRFQITRRDGSTTDISYAHCLRRPTPRMRFSAAARTAIADDIIAFKAQSVPRGVAGTSVHVDHVWPDTFEQLVERYIAARRIDLGAVRYADAGDRGQRFADRALEADWQTFHRLRARLRVISALHNLKIGRGPGPCADPDPQEAPRGAVEQTAARR